MTDFVETTSEEKMHIAQHFLLSSPPGQFNEVLSDLRKITSPPSLLEDDTAAGIARISNLKNYKVIKIPSGKNSLLCPEAEIDASHYFDALSRTVFKVDHLSLDTEEAVDVETARGPEIGENVRATVQNSVNNILANNYLTEHSAVGVYLIDGGLSIVMSGEKVNLRNYWAGKWSSSWKVQVDTENDYDEERPYKISGTVKVHIHYFEDGNLQLNR